MATNIVIVAHNLRWHTTLDRFLRSPHMSQKSISRPGMTGATLLTYRPRHGALRRSTTRVMPCATTVSTRIFYLSVTVRMTFSFYLGFAPPGQLHVLVHVYKRKVEGSRFNCLVVIIDVICNQCGSTVNDF